MREQFLFAVCIVLSDQAHRLVERECITKPLGEVPDRAIWVARFELTHTLDLPVQRPRSLIRVSPAFDVNNLEYYLNTIPFSDHGARLDPPTEDVTARCISMLAQLGETAETSKAVADGIAYLRQSTALRIIGSW